MATHTLHCCQICEQPVEITGGQYINVVEKRYTGKHAIVLTLGYSNGGWGHRQNWLETGEMSCVCNDCFRQVEALSKPLVEFIRNRGKREGDKIQPVRRDEPSSERRGTSLLRFLPSFR